MGLVERYEGARRVLGAQPAGHGPYSQADDHFVDPKPYVDVYSNGTFRGYGDSALWRYFKFPWDVNVHRVKSADEVMNNQYFLVRLFDKLGDMLGNQTERTRGDIRRPFHIQMTKDIRTSSEGYPGIPEAHLDYLNRAVGQLARPVWNGYMGVQLHPRSVWNEAYGWRAKVGRYFEVMRNPEALEAQLFREDTEDITNAFVEEQFSSLDFLTSPEDLTRLTAWHGVKDTDFGLDRSLVTTRFQEPVHGLSLITPRWGEVSFHALRPMAGTFMVSPTSDLARFADGLFQPGSNIVVINIRGEVRASRVAAALLDDKRLARQESASKKSKGGRDISEDEKAADELDRLGISKTVANDGHALLDNVEIVVGVQVVPGQPINIDRIVGRYGLQAVPIVSRQPAALNSTFPTYPKSVARHKRGNSTRSPLASQMFPGVLAMSGLFRRTRPCAPGGLWMGLSDTGGEFADVYTGIQGAYELSGSPVLLITGTPGSGKSQAQVHLLIQAAMQGYGAAFLNPKPDSTFQQVFDYLGGQTVNFGTAYLKENPGCMDPTYYFSPNYEGRMQVGQILWDAISQAMKMSQDLGSIAAMEQSVISSEITDRAVDLRYRTSGEIIFGNPQLNLPGLSSENVKNFVRNRMNTSFVWRGLISMEPTSSQLTDFFRSGKPLLIEWDKSMRLSSKQDASGAAIEAKDIDVIISLNLAFLYSAELVGRGKRGGLISVDEASNLKQSAEVMRLLNRGARDWRQSNIMVVLGTQRLNDFLDDTQYDMSSFIDRYLIMNIASNDTKGLEKFHQITGLDPADPSHAQFITHAKATPVDPSNPAGQWNPARAYYVDNLYGWHGRIFSGPWPQREMALTRTDKAGEESRRRGVQPVQEGQTNLTVVGMDDYRAAAAELQDPIADPVEMYIQSGRNQGSV